MTINSIGAAQMSSDAASRANLDTQQFLKLLITELTSQNPLDPMKDREFMAQLAAMNTAQSAEKMGKAVTASIAASLVGRNVQASLPDGSANIEGKVEWVEFANGTARVRVGEHTIPFESVYKVY